MQKYIKLSEVHAAIQNETFSLKTTDGQMTVEVLDVNSYHVYAKGIFEPDSHIHDIVVKLTNEKGVSEEADIIVKESYENLSCAFDNLRNSREIKDLMDSIVQSVDRHVSENHHAVGVKSLLRQAAIDHNKK